MKIPPAPFIGVVIWGNLTNIAGHEKMLNPQWV
jgi:hypothetical protein